NLADVIAPSLQPGNFVVEPGSLSGINRMIEMATGFFVAATGALRSGFTHGFVSGFRESLEPHQVHAGSNRSLIQNLEGTRSALSARHSFAPPIKDGHVILPHSPGEMDVKRETDDPTALSIICCVQTPSRRQSS